MLVEFCVGYPRYEGSGRHVSSLVAFNSFLILRQLIFTHSLARQRCRSATMESFVTTFPTPTTRTNNALGKLTMPHCRTWWSSRFFTDFPWTLECINIHKSCIQSALRHRMRVFLKADKKLLQTRNSRNSWPNRTMFFHIWERLLSKRLDQNLL